MAEATTHSGSRGILAALLEHPFARRMVRDGRYTIPICIILICGCFAAAALLQMRLDRNHALAQATAFEHKRIQALARTTGLTLDRYARLATLFAASPEQFRGADLGPSTPIQRLLLPTTAYLNRSAQKSHSAGWFPNP